MQLAAEIKKIGVLGIIVGFIGLISSIASLVALGTYGLIASITLTVLLFLFCFWILRPVLLRNTRGVTMLEALNSVGLVDVENRGDPGHHLPPPSFYGLARHEIVITGATGYGTFEQHLESIQAALKRGVKVYVLLLHPASPDVGALNQFERAEIHNQLQGTIEIIKKAQLCQHPGLRIRFLPKLPPFRSVMIDGDISPTGAEPLDGEAQLRVQPHGMYKTAHGGIILQFRKMKGRPGAFDYFAEDLRQQWRQAQEDRQIFGLP